MERIEKMNRIYDILCFIDTLCMRTNYENDMQDENIQNFLGEPACWDGYYNRQQFYAAMATKLLLAYIIAEVRVSDDFLHFCQKDLESLRSKQIESWNEFNDNPELEERKIGNVLTSLCDMFMKRQKVLLPKSTAFFCGMDFLVPEEDPNLKEKCKDILIKEMPDLVYADLGENDLYNLTYFACFDYDLVIECYQCPALRNTDVFPESLMKSVSELKNINLFRNGIGLDVMNGKAEDGMPLLFQSSGSDIVVSYSASFELGPLDSYFYSSIFYIWKVEMLLEKYENGDG